MSCLLHCSFFTKAADNIPHPWEGTWVQLQERLAHTYNPRRGTTGDEAKKTLPAVSGTRFREGTLRARVNAVDLSLLIMDFDNAAEEPIPGECWPDARTGEPSNRPKLRKVRIDLPVTFDEVQRILQAAKVASCTWTTWSNRPDWPKFRVVVPLAHAVPAELWGAATEWALKHLGIDPFRSGLDLPVLRDIARLNFLPGAVDPTTIRRAATKGRPLAIPLNQLGPATLPVLPVSPWQAEIQAIRKAELKAGEYWFQSYIKPDGRGVDFKTLDLAALLERWGIVVGLPQAYRSGTKWRCHCPLAHEHSGGVDDDCAVVIQSPDQWPSFHCAHSHHAHLGLRDVIELFWGRP